MKLNGERFVKHLNMSWDLFLQHMGRYLFAKSFVSGRVVLDAACGSGYGSKILSENAKKVIGIDTCNETIRYCYSRYQDKNLSFCQMDCKYLAFPSSCFDIVISFETLEHLKDPYIFSQELKRVLKDNGILIISTPNKENFSIYTKGRKNPYHFKEFTESEFVEIINNDFQLESVLGQRYFAEKDVSLLAEYTDRQIPYGNDNLGRRIVRVGLRTLLPQKARANKFLPMEIWANKCRVGDAVPSKAVYMIAIARKSENIFQEQPKAKCSPKSQSLLST
jgi:SAM-dependent methyltransferase